MEGVKLKPVKEKNKYVRIKWNYEKFLRRMRGSKMEDVVLERYVIRLYMEKLGRFEDEEGIVKIQNFVDNMFNDKILVEAIDFDHNLHLKQVKCMGERFLEVVTLNKLERILTDDALKWDGRVDLKRIKGCESVKIVKQREDLLLVLEFLMKYSKSGDVVVCDGILGGVEYLTQLFPKIRIVELADSTKKYKDVLFISFKDDMEKQRKLVEMLIPRVSLLIFDGTMKYFEGQLVLPVFGNGSNCRLVVTKDGINTYKSYDNFKQQMECWNYVTRVKYYDYEIVNKDMDHCYDCAAEMVIVGNYVKLNKDKKVVEILDNINNYSIDEFLVARKRDLSDVSSSEEDLKVMDMKKIEANAQILLKTIGKEYILPGRQTKKYNDLLTNIRNFMMEIDRVEREEVVAFMENLLKTLKRSTNARTQERGFERIAAITALVGNVKVRNLLDIGAGNGEITKLLKAHYNLKSSNVYAIDQKLVDDKEFKIIDYDNDEYAIPLKNNSVDLIVLMVVLHHIEPSNRLKILQECNRVLTPQGIIVIREHDDDKDPYFYTLIQPYTRLLVCC